PPLKLSIAIYGLRPFIHYVWTFPFRNKSEVYYKFEQFFSYVKKHVHATIQNVQCDHGGEFDNKNVHTLFGKPETLFRFSCPHTLQQNDKVERILCTLNNVIRTLLFQANLPPTMWAESLHMVTHLINIIPIKALSRTTPHAKLFNSPPTYTHLRVFRCLCYSNLSSTMPHKLSPRFSPCIFLGYASNHRGYKCLDISTSKIIISRHVVFDETKFPYNDSDFCSSSSDILKSTIEESHPLTSNYYLSAPQNHGPSLQSYRMPQSPPANPNLSNSPSSTTGPTSLPIPTNSAQPITHPPDPTAPFIHDPTSTTPLPNPNPSLPPSTNPIPSTNTHSMCTRAKDGISKPKTIFNLNTTVSPLPTNHKGALQDPQWCTDIVLTASSPTFLRQVITTLSTEFAMTDLESLHYFLGVAITATSDGLHLSQSKYANELLIKAGMANCNPCRTLVDTFSKLSQHVGEPASDPTLYQSLVGALQYLTFTRLDISYAVQQCCLLCMIPGSLTSWL
ncbi:hypothetical protein V2J09_005445, partial [Rumex salicifolius]